VTVADEIFLPGRPRSVGRHRALGALSAAASRVVASVRNLELLSPRWRFLSEPFEVWFGGAAAVTGATVQWSPKSRPQSLVAQLSPWLVHAWGVLLIVGGVATVVARWRIGRWRPGTAGTSVMAPFRLEVVGMICLATALGVYSVAILANGRAGLAAGLLTMAPAWACAVRARIVSRQLTMAERAGSGGDG
jgi:hypothetical protein